MENLQNYLNQIATSEIATSSNGSKIEQKASRQIKENATQLLMNALASVENSNIKIMRTSNGIGIALDNEIGFIPLEISISVKNLDYDIFEENEEYNNHLAEMKAKAEEKAKAKAQKVKADTERRAKAKAEREAKGE